MEQLTVWIILAAVLGTLVLSLAVVLALFCWRRSKRRVRGFSLRAVTPLDDAEFESWRRPSQYTQRPQKYGIRPALPPPARTNMLEKDVGTWDAPRTPSPQEHISFNYPMSPIRKPERVRRKSSTCSSLADRPPTPYSPSSKASEFPRSSITSSKTYVGSPRIHYPSMSEASAFNFDLKDMSFDSAKYRPSSQSDRPLNLSFESQSYLEKLPSHNLHYTCLTATHFVYPLVLEDHSTFVIPDRRDTNGDGAPETNTAVSSLGLQKLLWYQAKVSPLSYSILP
ncbi:hypothetical protein BU23DRAFT_572209 [Bimuria novae-zelandiae CBS 107.79]|uniref:Uncharacterized protein n=1 Tax=Bimuria novae-zelandiae CBS 107.79 TaxID=1447943 RepID=A0A6A5V0I8_9PLEO|nr:hypothetical protein BU23DRAFT_572209 [Bimuria novae-zelandiae CBS 107.79]